jgi:hypothetical protein
MCTGIPDDFHTDGLVGTNFVGAPQAFAQPQNRNIPKGTLLHQHE